VANRSTQPIRVATTPGRVHAAPDGQWLSVGAPVPGKGWPMGAFGATCDSVLSARRVPRRAADIERTAEA